MILATAPWIVAGAADENPPFEGQGSLRSVVESGPTFPTAWSPWETNGVHTKRQKDIERPVWGVHWSWLNGMMDRFSIMLSMFHFIQLPGVQIDTLGGLKFIRPVFL